MKPNVNDNRPMAVLGNVNSGKTNLMFYMASLCTHEKKYTLGYPKEIEGYTKLSSLQDLSKISNCILLIDEIDEFIPIYQNKSNASLKRLLKFTAHNNIKLIFTTQLSQFVTKMMEALVPQWAICNIDIFSLKNGSKPKRILINYIKDSRINQEVGMNLGIGTYVWFNDMSSPGENGVHSFPNMNVKKDWSNVKENPERNPEQKAEQQTETISIPTLISLSNDMIAKLVTIKKEKIIEVKNGN